MNGSNVRSGNGPRIDPDAMPPEELARLRADGYGGLIAHRTTVLDLTHPQDPLGLFGAQCSCGWQSESLWSDPEAAEEDAATHEREANHGC